MMTAPVLEEKALKETTTDGSVANKSLLRNGRAIAFSSSLTSGLGVLYWILAAHIYTQAVVGTNLSAISAMMFVGGLASLNMSNALIIIIPAGGARLRRVVGKYYLIVMATALCTGTIFVAGLPIWAPAFRELATSTQLYVGFAFATTGWCAFLLQDGALTGMRRALWIPVENGVFAVAKIVFLLVFAKRFPVSGILLSWIAALYISILPTNALIFLRGLSHARTAAVHPAPLRIGRYLGVDYLSSLCWSAVTLLIPILVLNVSGAKANAAFSVAWSMAYALYLLPIGMGQSLVAEASADRQRIRSLSRHAWKHSMQLTIPLTAVLVIGAPLVLQIFSAKYREAATPTLRLLSLSAIPNVATALAVSVARARQQLARVFATVATISVLVLAITLALLPRLGIVGVGWAWLIGQTIVAAVVYRIHLRPHWHDGPGPEHALIARAQALLGSFPMLLGKGWLRRADQSANLHATTRRTLYEYGLYGPVVQIPTVSDLSVLEVSANSLNRSFLKIARTTSGSQTLVRQSYALDMLRGTSNIPESWLTLLPVVSSMEMRDGRAVCVERAAPGTPARNLLHTPEQAQAITTTTLAAIRPLHTSTGSRQDIDLTCVDELVHDRLTRLTTLVPGLQSAHYTRAIQATREACVEGLRGGVAWRSWTHGDYWPGNVLVDPVTNAVTGIVDWEGASPNGLASLDIVHLLLTTRVATTNTPLGKCVSQLLGGGALTEFETAKIQTAHDLDGARGPDFETLLRLAWLSHVVNNLEKSTRYRNHRLWVHTNVETVLTCHLK